MSLCYVKVWWPGVYQRQARQLSPAQLGTHIISYHTVSAHCIVSLYCHQYQILIAWQSTIVLICLDVCVLEDVSIGLQWQPPPPSPVTWVKDGGPMRGRVWPRLHQSQAELTKPSQFRLLLYDDAALGRGWWLERGSLGWRETFSPDMEAVFDNTWNGEDNT